MENSFETEWDRPEFDSVPSLALNAVYLLPGCDDTILRKTLLETYRDFCKRSAALRTWRRIPVAPRVTHYPVSPVLSGEIDCVTQVRWPGGHVPARHWRVEGDPPVLHFPGGFPRGIFFVPHGVAIVQDRVNVGSLPVGVENVREHHHHPWHIWVEAVEIPHLNEERAPKAFLRRYGEAIVDGALVRLFSMTGRTWSDPEQARQRGAAYNNALSEARLRSLQGGDAANVAPTIALDMSAMV